MLCQLVKKNFNIKGKGCRKSYTLHDKWKAVKNANEVGI